MPPRGESTGIAIKDGALFAKIPSQRDTRSLEHHLPDFESVWRVEIEKYYKSELIILLIPGSLCWTTVSSKSFIKDSIASTL
jgi:hypothetical protein